MNQKKKIRIIYHQPNREVLYKGEKNLIHWGKIQVRRTYMIPWQSIWSLTACITVLMFYLDNALSVVYSIK